MDKQPRILLLVLAVIAVSATALQMLHYQVAGRPLEYIKADNNSDPVIAVDKARQLVESDRISVMLGPIFSPAAQAVTDYLGKSSRIPQISIVGQTRDNLGTANGLAFMPNGLAEGQAYYFGKYVSEVLGYKTVNAIHYEDTAAHQLQEGFERAFVTEGGGTIVNVTYAPKQTGGDTTPEKVIKVMSTLSIETPAGKVTMSPHKDAFIATRNWYIVKAQDVGGGRISWVPIHVYNQVLLAE